MCRHNDEREHEIGISHDKERVEKISRRKSCWVDKIKVYARIECFHESIYVYLYKCT